MADMIVRQDIAPLGDLDTPKGKARLENELRRMQKEIWSLSTTTATLEDIDIDNLHFDGNTISTTAGDLYLDSFDGNIYFSGDSLTDIDDINCTSITIGTDTLDTNEWAYLNGQNQTVKSTSSPTFVVLTLSTGLDVPEIYNSGGNLKIEPDAQYDVVLFGDTDVLNATTDGKSLYIYRKAAEGDEYLQIYINHSQQAIINASSTTIYKSSGATTLTIYGTAIEAYKEMRLRADDLPFVFGYNYDYGIGYKNSTDTLDFIDGRVMGSNIRAIMDASGNFTFYQKVRFDNDTEYITSDDANYLDLYANTGIRAHASFCAESMDVSTITASHSWRLEPGTSGGLIYTANEANVEIDNSVDATFWLEVSAPIGCQLIGTQLRIDEAFEPTESWHAVYDNSSGYVPEVKTDITSTKNHKENVFFNPFIYNPNPTTENVCIRIRRADAAGISPFTKQSPLTKVTAITYFKEFTDMASV